MSFVHLHCHTEYSLLDGANRIDDLVARAREFEQPAIAVTDHGVMHAAWEFQEKAKAAGIKPIIGMEAYVAPGDRRVKSRSATGSKPYYHLVLLARDAVGYKNLVKLSSLGFTEGFYTRPRVDRELLAKYSEGIIVSSACMAGEVAVHLLNSDLEAAKAAASWYADVFQDRYYLEVQAHEAPNQQLLNERIFALAKDMSLPVIATNDAHFLRAEDHDAHDVLLCIGLGKDRSDANRMRYDRGLYFKNAGEMRDRFPSRPDVLENTLAIADSVSVSFSKGYKLPSFPLPQGIKSENELLVELAEAGARRRYGDPLPSNARERLDYEVGVITKTGYAGYFLIVHDFISAARDRGIPVGPGRGSAAGSLVAYSLGITDVDPLAFDLLFERFLNPERISMPDIDIDFCFERRGEVIEYVRQKYGRESVAQIITFGTLKSRAVIKDVGRTLGFTPQETDQLAKLIPNLPNYSLTVKEAIERVPEVEQLYENEARYRQLLDYAIALEGLARHAGVHAAGVVIAPGPVDEYVPVCTQNTRGASSASGENEYIVVSQYDMNALDKAGLLKMDFLGLRNLTVLDDALRNIVANGKEPVDLDEISKDLTDKATYDLLARGETLGVFQFDGGPMRSLLRLMRPDNFEDISAVGALYRPGPMGANSHTNYALRKNGQQEITPIHPELAEPLEEILGQTYGLIVYQEQVMAIAQKVAGYSLGKADLLRRAMGKKKKSVLDAEYVGFEAGMKANGFSAAAVKTLWDILVPFADYAFNKAHSAAYGLVSYWTAYLKANYPAEYMAGLLTSVGDDKDRRPVYLAECRRMGIKVLPPDVNESSWDFTAVGTDIRFGLASVRNVGHNVVDSIVRAREEKGAFKDFADFMRKIDTVACNKKVIESLAKAGAFDSLGHSRQGIAAIHANAVDQAMGLKRKEAEGQFDLFGGFGADGDGGDTDPFGSSLDIAIPTADWSKAEKLVFERDMLGLYVSDHPLHGVEHVLTAHADTALAEIIAGGVEDGANVTVAGILTAVGPRTNKQGAPWAIATIEDLEAGLEVLFFPKTWAQVSDKVVRDQIVVVKGRISRRDDTPSLFASEVTIPELTEGPRGPVLVSMPAARCTPPVVERLREVLGSHPGTTEVQLKLLNGGRETVLRLDQGLRVRPSTALMGDIKALLGPTSVALL
jgi:DNA polymerase-3 subunit alpha